MSPTILVVEDEPAIQELVAYACQTNGFEVRRTDSVRSAPRGRVRRTAGSRPARLDAAGPPRDRLAARVARPGANEGASRHHAHRQGQRSGQGDRPRRRRRRLCGEAVLPARAGLPDPRRVPSARPATGGRRDGVRPTQAGCSAARGACQRQPPQDGTDRVQAAVPSSWRIPIASSRARSCWTACGATTCSSRSARSTCTCCVCARLWHPHELQAIGADGPRPRVSAFPAG